MSEYLSYEEKTAEVYKEIIKCLNYCIEEKEAMWKAADENTDMCETIKGIFEDGKTEGESKSRLEIAKEMLDDNVPIETIMKYTKFPLSKIQELASEM